MADGKRALELISTVGAFGLGGTDGCICSHFRVQGVSVDIHCRKSGGATKKIAADFYGTVVRVYSASLDADGRELKAIADIVARQAQEMNGNAVMVRFCDYEADAKQLCVYCGKARLDQNGYLCEKCLTETTSFDGPIREQHDLRKYHFSLPCAE